MNGEFPAWCSALANSNQGFDDARRDPRVARDVALGQLWVFCNHRTLAEVIAAEGGQ